MQQEAVHTRAKRFHRLNNPPPIEVTRRDLNLLAHVARHRFLSSAHLCALDGGSPQNVLRTLRLLFDHGYLDRPAAQRVALAKEGPRPFVYGLGKAGARILREQGHLVDATVDWREKNKRAGTVFIEHTLAVADFMAGLELSCRGRSDVVLLREDEVLALAPADTRAAREPLRWGVQKVILGRKETCSVVPDGAFGLEFPDDTASYFMLEVDRGTIPVSRTDRQGTSAWRKSIQYKFATYWEGWKAKQHEKQFGLKQMRVAMVTTGRERVAHMLEEVRSLTEGKGTGFFLFTDQQALAAASPISASWINGRGQEVTLLD